MGRVAMSQSGSLRFWVGAVHSADNSQQIADWYSFSHIIHGFLLYGLCHLAGRGRGWSFGLRLVLAVFVESSWEVLENSSFIIDRYRHETLAWDYYGDSILNSVSDILFCVFGFVLAARLRVWVVIALAVAMEAGVMWVIRDGLILNVIMLIHPFEAIRHWQEAIG